MTDRFTSSPRTRRRSRRRRRAVCRRLGRRRLRPPAAPAPAPAAVDSYSVLLSACDACFELARSPILIASTSSPLAASRTLVDRRFERRLVGVVELVGVLLDQLLELVAHRLGLVAGFGQLRASSCPRRRATRRPCASSRSRLRTGRSTARCGRSAPCRCPGPWPRRSGCRWRRCRT